MIRSRSVLIKRNWVSVQDSIENESNENSGNAFDPLKMYCCKDYKDKFAEYLEWGKATVCSISTIVKDRYYKRARSSRKILKILFKWDCSHLDARQKCHEEWKDYIEENEFI